MSRKTRRKTDRINVRIRCEDVEIQAYIESLHPSVSLSDMARQSILYCISNQVFKHPVKSGHHPEKMVQKSTSEANRKTALNKQPIVKSSKEKEDDSDFSSLLDSLDL